MAGNGVVAAMTAVAVALARAGYEAFGSNSALLLPPLRQCPPPRRRLLIVNCPTSFATAECQHSVLS